MISGYGGIVRQIMYSDTDGGLIYDRTSQNGGSSWSDWVQTVTFDHIPWDVVQTDTPQTFTAQQTFSTAPIDQTTGHPYITKDGVPSIPSDVARTGQSQTFTAAQTFSSAPTVQDTSSSKGDNQVALMGDLKSVEKSAWHQLDSSLNKFRPIHLEGYYHTDCLYKIDPVNKRIYIQWMIVLQHYGTSGKAYLDFSGIVSKFTSKGYGGMISASDYGTVTDNGFGIGGGKISYDVSSGYSVIVSGPLKDCWFGYDTLLI